MILEVNKEIGKAEGTYTGEKLYVYIPQNEFVELRVLYPGLFAHAGNVCMDTVYLLAQHFDVEPMVRRPWFMPKPWIELRWEPTGKGIKVSGNKIVMCGEDIIEQRHIAQIVKHIWDFFFQ